MQCDLDICHKSPEFATCKVLDLSAKCYYNVEDCTWAACKSGKYFQVLEGCQRSFQDEYPSATQFLNPEYIQKCKENQSECTDAICGNSEFKKFDTCKKWNEDKAHRTDEQKAAIERKAEERAAEQKARDDRETLRRAIEKKAREEKEAARKAAEKKAREEKEAARKAAEAKAAALRAAAKKAAEEKAANAKAYEHF